MFWIIVIIALALWIWATLFRDPKAVREAYEGKTPEQKEVIRYFLIDGCLRKKMSDAEYEAYVHKTIPDLKQAGMDKIGLDEDQIREIEPVHFENYVFDNDSFQKKGDDEVWRSSKYQVTWVFFSDTQVFLYQRTISLDEKKDKVRTEEYFYRDITNFSTVSETEEITVLGGNGETEKLQVDTTKFKLVVPGDSFLCAMTQNEYTESSIQGMKAKLREKKLSSK